MKKNITVKTLIPISVIIAMIPVVSFIFEINTKCQILAAEVNAIDEERKYLMSKIDTMADNIDKIQISVGVIEHELRSDTLKKTR